MPIYTRTGDGGETSLAGGRRVSKTHPRLEAYGTIDELASHIGLLMAYLRDTLDEHRSARYLTTLDDIQTQLFIIGGMLARENPEPLPQQCVAAIEHAIDDLAADLPPWRGFILPGGSIAAAQAHVCRTVCRRAERRIYALRQALLADSAKDPATDSRVPSAPDPALVIYVNRLSDYLFVLAQHINQQMDIAEKLFRKPKA